MLIAHAPAGYILSKLTSRLWFKDSKLYICAGVLGSIASDFDVIYWHVVDNKTVNHHEYWTHIPYSWLPVIPIAFVLFLFSKRAGIATLFFLANVYLHLALDSFLAGIKWLYPKSNEYISLISPKDIPVLKPPCDPIYTLEYGKYSYEIDGWMYNLAMHWTFQVEIAIVCFAVITFLYFLIRR